MLTGNTLINNSNNIIPLSNRVNIFSQKNSSNVFNDFSQKPNLNINGTQREFGKDLTNQNNLTTLNKENFCRILVNKNNLIKKDNYKINQILINEYRRQKSQDTYSKNIFGNTLKENKQNFSSKKLPSSNEDIFIEDINENNNNNNNINNNINNNEKNKENNKIPSNLNIDKIIINELLNNEKNNNPKIENEEKEISNSQRKNFLDKEKENNKQDQNSIIKNPQYVEEYFNDIFETLKSTEKEFLPDSDYMSKRTDINSKMRSILNDWLVEVHMKYKLVPETLYITINIIDRYLSLKDIKRNKLQLVGVTSMFIASKYEDIYPPEVKDFSYITDHAYTKKEILNMEIDILSSLNFNITFPTPFRFIEIYKQILNFDDKTFTFAWYCIELCLIEYKMIKYKPSFLSACAVFCSYRLLDLDEKGVPEAMGYTYNDIKNCCLEICGLIDAQKKSNLKGIYKKFSLEKYFKVADITF